MLTSICLIVLVTGLQAQQASYGAPSSAGYDASSAGYTAPEASYSAPGDSYAAGYNSYDYDGGYVATQEDGGLDLSKLTELLDVEVLRQDINIDDHRISLHDLFNRLLTDPVTGLTFQQVPKTYQLIDISV